MVRLAAVFAESDTGTEMRVFVLLGSAESGLTWHGLAPSQMVKIKTVCVCSRVHVCLRACRVYTFVGKRGENEDDRSAAILLLYQANKKIILFRKTVRRDCDGRVCGCPF